MAKINFAFDNGRDVFFPGETIRGFIIISVNLNSVVRCKRLVLEFKGFSKVRWEETIGTGDEKSTKTYEASETYLTNFVDLTSDLTSRVMGGIRSNEGVPLYPGESYNIPFSFWLPSGLPGSVEEKFGMVRYSAKATLERISSSPVHNIRHFSVMEILDLNHFDVVSQPIEDEDVSNLCCLWCASGPIKTRIRLQRTGFVPGEDLVSFIRVENQSGNPINGSTVSLEKKVKFKADGKVKSTTDNVGSVDILTFVRSSHGTEFEVSLRVPPVPASDLKGCNLMDISFHLLLSLSPKGCHSNIQMAIPIKIGTIPLRNTFEQLSFPASAPPMEQAMSEENPPPYNQAAYPPSTSSGYPFQGFAPPGSAFPPINQAYPPTRQSTIIPNEIYSQYPTMPIPRFDSAVQAKDEDIADFEVVGEFQPKYFFYGK